MKPFNFFEYWNDHLTCSKIDKIFFFALFFFSILATLSGIFLFIFALINFSIIEIPTIFIPISISMVIGFGFTTWYLWIREYSIYRKSFKK